MISCTCHSCLLIYSCTGNRNIICFIRNNQGIFCCCRLISWCQSIPCHLYCFHPVVRVSIIHKCNRILRHIFVYRNSKNKCCVFVLIRFADFTAFAKSCHNICHILMREQITLIHHIKFFKINRILSFFYIAICNYRRTALQGFINAVPSHALCIGKSI